MDTWSAVFRRWNCAEHWRALILSPSIRARGSSRTDFIASPATQYTSVSLWGRLGWRSWSILRGCSSPCQLASSSSIASSSRAKNDISSASSEMNISTTNVSGAGSSSHRAQTVRATAVKYEGRTNRVPNSSAADLLLSPNQFKSTFKNNHRDSPVNAQRSLRFRRPCWRGGRFCPEFCRSRDR
jgi:hypothetical protein